MIDYSSNIDVVIGGTLEKIKELRDNPDALLRTVALAVLPELRHRVHVEGKDSAGNQIGIYSPGYLKLRTGQYNNAGRISRGANKGKTKDSGTFTSGKSAGKPRPQYHRSSDPKVILSLTRQMENDLSVSQTPTGWGIGYTNPFNFQKAMWCEETYKKPILSKLMDSEKELAVQTAEQFSADYLK